MKKKRKCDEDTNHVAISELRESRGMIKMPGIISTSAKPGVWVGVIPDSLRDVNSGEMEGKADSGYSSNAKQESSDERTRSSLGGLDENGIVFTEFERSCSGCVSAVPK